MGDGGKTLYLECESGISGDMTVAALLDLGADQEGLLKMLRGLPVGGFEVKVSRVKKAGLDACDFAVILDQEHENHDHDMAYLHGEDEPSGDGRGRFHSHELDHSHGHEHRGLKEIFAIIDKAELTDRARELAKRIFDILADAESEAHGVPKDEVHFHEVGAADSIADILSAAFCLDNLGIREVIVPCLNEGIGSIRCQHGIIPVPAPATLNIAMAHHLPLHITKVRGELVTPTGAAIAAAVCTSHDLPKTFTVEKLGMGAGKRSYDCPGVLRAMLIRAEPGEKDKIWKLETNIDDCTGENLGYCLELLMEAGARDAHYIPVYMKKNRPAYQLNVLCDEEDISRMERIIFEETTTIGIRRVPMERTVLKREFRTVRTPLGEGVVKICRYGNNVQFFPEYNSVAKLCRESGCHYREAYEALLKACKADTEE